MAEWRVRRKGGTQPPNVPSAPDATYMDGGWQGWGHWLGTGNQSNKAKKEKFLPFDRALRAARQLRLVSEKEWRLWCRSGARPANMPSHANSVYVHEGWMGWMEWVHWLHHTNLGAAPAPAAARPASKRAALGGAGALGKSGDKRRRR